MKRIIANGNQLTPFDVIDAKMYEFAQMGGYDAKVSPDDYSVQLKCSSKYDPEFMPKVSIKTVADGKTYSFIPTVIFPNIEGEDSELLYWAEYYIDKWVNVGKMVQYIAGFTFNSDDYENITQEV